MNVFTRTFSKIFKSSNQQELDKTKNLISAINSKENAIKSLVMWKAGREDVREVQIFAAGVSGDTADVIHPITGATHKLRRVLQFSWFINGSVDQIALKPLPRRAVSGGTSILRLSTDEKDGIGGNDVRKKWIYR